MCGICGYLNRDALEPANLPLLQRMGHQLLHRGPDDEGQYVDRNLGFAFRRLSIIDIELGHQPMSNEDETVWIVFNGEIFNHAELRDQLVARGHTYHTRSDTETLIHLYEQEGIDGFSRLNGMFALAIWDAREKRLVLARDRLGVKPLHYYLDDRVLVFGSEIKAILAHPRVPAEVNADRLEECFRYRYVAGAETLFRRVQNLLPGHALVCDQGRIVTRRFWDFPLERLEERVSEGSAIDHLEALLQDSVKLRLMSEVPVGTMCSGGIDSGLVTAHAVRAGMSGVDTYSVGFAEAEFDESVHARAIAERYRTHHHVLVVSGQEFADLLPGMIWHLDEPLNHENSIPIYAISKLARERVTVVLTGEGADELFLGYPRYHIVRAATASRAVPLFVRRALSRSVRTGPRKLRKVLEAVGHEEDDALLENSAVLGETATRAILSPDVPRSQLEYRRGLLADSRVARLPWHRRITYLDSKTYLVSILNRMDKMTMAASIEGRVPFLDYRIAEWAFSLPLGLKLRGVQTKRIVKRLGERYLPSEIVHRPKSGFGVPIAAWLRSGNGLGRYLDLLTEPGSRLRGFVRDTEVARIVGEHRAGQFDRGNELWQLVNLELWLRESVGSSRRVVNNGAGTE